ncbi:MAG: heme b synthase [Deltaproteobacteria bacterium]|nr:heme b synthase [Deltaproteobacteria bacterium]
MEEHNKHHSSPRLIAWEITRTCNLNCIHCRAASGRDVYPDELDTAKSIEILDQIRQIGEPIVIITGGEPLLREDVFLLAEHGTRLGLRMVMATNGTLLTSEIVERLKSSGIRRVSVSIDGADSRSHDGFRKVEGAFNMALKGIDLLRQGGVEFQINTTVTRQNVGEVKDIMELAIKIGAAAHHIFLLVPTGRAKDLVHQEIDSGEYERLLLWFYKMRDKVPLYLKATCAPQYYRIIRQQAKREGKKVDFDTFGLDAVTRGCLAGTAFCFISHDGIIQPCGYLEINCGDLKKSEFGEVWQNSEIFNKLRDYSTYGGKCGRCEYQSFCGGCRARAYESTGDYLAEEPLCVYQPKPNETQ